MHEAAHNIRRLKPCNGLMYMNVRTHALHMILHILFKAIGFYCSI